MSTDPLERADSPSEREAILGILADQIREIDDRLDDEVDPNDLEAQRMQVKWTRTLGYLAGQYRKLMKDTDIDELEEDVELLETVAGLDE
ncbi:hypothetical protein [Halococcus agarilyticus]|uniref:hypothetical protein n=1 Tax=Halococcus agarilyticus TaxID=1232219 RepID=UPI000677BDFA|nr:hypothetical protein [Halococcus agarilyticus]